MVEHSREALIRLGEGAVLPEQHGDWWDLAIPEDMHFDAGEFYIVPFNICFKPPVGFETWIVPRSSTFMKWGLMMANSFGVIEHDYCGDDDVIGFPCCATRTVDIPKHTRIAQMRISRMQPEIKLVVVKHMPDASRGGYGSTGEKAGA